MRKLKNHFKQHDFKLQGVFPFILLTLILTGCKEKILHNLDELRANQVKLVLSQAKITSEKIKEGTTWSIAVSDSQVDEALLALENSHLLKKDLNRFQEANQSILQNSDEQEFVKSQKLAWNLEKTIEAFPGVLEARVHLNLSAKKQNILEDSATNNKTASCLIIRESITQNLNEEAITELIHGASGISKDKISVVISDKFRDNSATSASQVLKVKTSPQVERNKEAAPKESSPTTATSLATSPGTPLAAIEINAAAFPNESLRQGESKKEKPKNTLQTEAKKTKKGTVQGRDEEPLPPMRTKKLLDKTDKNWPTDNSADNSEEDKNFQEILFEDSDSNDNTFEDDIVNSSLEDLESEDFEGDSDYSQRSKELSAYAAVTSKKDKNTLKNTRSISTTQKQARLNNSTSKGTSKRTTFVPYKFFGVSLILFVGLFYILFKPSLHRQHSEEPFLRPR